MSTDYRLRVTERNGRTLAVITYRGRYLATVGAETELEARAAFARFLASR